MTKYVSFFKTIFFDAVKVQHKFGIKNSIHKKFDLKIVTCKLCGSRMILLVPFMTTTLSESLLETSNGGLPSCPLVLLPHANKLPDSETANE
jgi:hypothetical protein